MSEELERLREENAEHHEQMRQLNEEMDRMLLKRDKGGKKLGNKPQSSEPDGKPYELRQAMAKNEQLRKERLKWWAEISHSDTAVRISDAKNELGVQEQKILAIKEEIRGLENIRKNQQHVVDVAKHANDEVSYLRSAHRNEVSDFREQWRQLNDENKHSEKILTMWQNKYHTAQEKLKLGLTGQDVQDLRDTVDRQGAQIEELNTKLEDLTGQQQSARSVGNKTMDAHTREKSKLQRELDAAKETLKERERELKLSYARGQRLLNGTGTLSSPTGTMS